MLAYHGPETRLIPGAQLDMGLLRVALGIDLSSNSRGTSSSRLRGHLVGSTARPVSFLQSRSRHPNPKPGSGVSAGPPSHSRPPHFGLSHFHPATLTLHNPHSETCICDVSALCAISCFQRVLVSFLSKVPAYGAGSPPVVLLFRCVPTHPRNAHKLNSLE